MRSLDRLICLFYNSRARLRCAFEREWLDDWWCCCFRLGESRVSFLFLHVREYCNSGRLKAARAHCDAPALKGLGSPTRFDTELHRSQVREIPISKAP